MLLFTGIMELEKTNLLESLSFFSNSKGMRANKLENFLQKKNNIQREFAQAECQLKQKQLLY
jgi:recombinational DNA repair ATPase RecF